MKDTRCDADGVSVRGARTETEVSDSGSHAVCDGIIAVAFSDVSASISVVRRLVAIMEAGVLARRRTKDTTLYRNPDTVLSASGKKT